MRKNKKSAVSGNLVIAIVLFVLLIILLVIGSLDIGLEVKISYVDSVDYFDLIAEGRPQAVPPVPIERAPQVKTITIGSIDIKNDFFIPKSYKLPRIAACAYSSETNSGVPLSPYITEQEDFERFYENAVDIGAGKEKTMQIEVYSITYYDLQKQPYDKIIVFEVKEQLQQKLGYTKCDVIDAKKQEGVIIDIVKEPVGNCTESSVCGDIEDECCPGSCTKHSDYDCCLNVGGSLTSAGCI